MKIIKKITTFQIVCCSVLAFMSIALSEFSLAKALATNDIAKFFSSDGIHVTKALYPKAETARQMLDTQNMVGGVNKFEHLSSLTPNDFQPVVRMNRDACYSKAVVDVSQGATITLPKVPEGMYLSMQPVT